MSKAKAKKLIPPIFLEFHDDIALNFLLKTHVGSCRPSYELLCRAWGIEKSGIDTWKFKTHQNEAWASTKLNRAKIVREHGKLVNYMYEYVCRKPSCMGKFVRQDVSVFNIDRSNHFIPLDYGVDDLIDELAAMIKANRGTYDPMLEMVKKLSEGIPLVGHTKPIAVNGHGYLKFV